MRVRVRATLSKKCHLALAAASCFFARVPLTNPQSPPAGPSAVLAPKAAAKLFASPSDAVGPGSSLGELCTPVGPVGPVGLA